MAEVVAEDDGIDKERVLHVHVLFPVNLLYNFVHFVGVCCLEFLDWLQNLHGCSCTEVGFIEHFLVAGERHHASAYFHIVGTQIDEFLGKNLL